MVYILALAAALSNALTSVFQRMGVEDAPESSTMRWSLIAHAIRRGIWLLGFAFMVCSFLLQAFALHAGRLSVVQPILTMELLFLVFILGTYFGYQISVREWVGASAIAFGLAGFLVFSDPGGGQRTPTNLGWIVVGGCATFAIAATVVATRWGPRWWKAAMFGSAGAIAFAFTAALIKVVGDYAAKDWVTLFVHWQTYGLIAFGLAGLFLTQNAYHAGPLAASQSTLVLVDPLASILFGIALFGDSLRTSNPWGPLEAFSLLVMFAGAVFLSNSPLITGMKGEGSGAEYEELLSRRVVKHFGHEEAEPAVPDSGLPPFSPT
jgi:drug/metabolite transporter (DMT)-like permease